MRIVKAIVKRIVEWCGQHKLLTVVLLAGGFFLYEIATIPFFGIAALKQGNPVETALMKQRIAEAKKSKTQLKIRQRWIALPRLPRHVVNAVIVAEDGLFYAHGGIDWFEVQESFTRNIDEGKFARGASTITQQLAKNLYLSTSKDPIRKFKEVLITLLLEQQLSKDRILEIYLNIIEWGRGIFGIEMAARTYFGKSASALTLDEATRLAAVIPSPLQHRPNEDSRYVLRRKRIVLERMRARSMASPSEGSLNPGAVAPMTSPELMLDEQTFAIDSIVNIQGKKE